jgi:hypothetical protein
LSSGPVDKCIGCHIVDVGRGVAVMKTEAVIGVEISPLQFRVHLTGSSPTAIAMARDRWGKS